MQSFMTQAGQNSHKSGEENSHVAWVWDVLDLEGQHYHQLSRARAPLRLCRGRRLPPQCRSREHDKPVPSAEHLQNSVIDLDFMVVGRNQETLVD